MWTTAPSGLIVPTIAPRRVNAVDLFAGAGGFSCGLHAAGVDVVAALEWDACAAITYLWNLGSRRFGALVGYSSEQDHARFNKALRMAQKDRRGLEARPGDQRWIGWHNHDEDLGCRAFFFGDASVATGSIIRELLDRSGWRGTIDVVVGGPPCQGFSRAGKQDPTDSRSNLVLEFVRIAAELDVGTWVLENVPPLLTDGKFGALRRALFAAANAAGYTVTANVLDAAGYGVPQFRRRAFVCGSRGKPVQLPMPTHWPLVVRPEDDLDEKLGRPAAELDESEEPQLELFGE